MNLPKRLLSLILCLAMTLALTAPVYAEELPVPEVIITSAETVDNTELTADEQDTEETVPTEEEAPAQDEEQSAPAKEVTQEEEAPAPEEEDTQDEEQKDTAETVAEPEEQSAEEDEDDIPVAKTIIIEKGTLTKTRISLTVGEKISLASLLTGAEADEFESSSTSVASVSDSGTVKAKKAGTTKITVTDTNDNEYTCTVKVSGVLSDTNIALAEGKTDVITLTGATISKVSTSDAEVATITKAGKITAVGNGTCTVTVTDTAGNTYTCKVTVTTSYLNRMAKNAQYVYGLVAKLHCSYGGTHTLAELKKKKKVTCNSVASVAMQLSGILKTGVIMGHTPARYGNETKKKNTVSKAIKKTSYLKKGTYTIVRAGRKYSQLPAKYKQAGMIYIQDSNMCVSAGGGYIYSCNQSSSQMKHGRYYRTKVKSGYPFNHPILYIIAPKG